MTSRFWRSRSMVAGLLACLLSIDCAAKKEADVVPVVTVDVAPVLNAEIQRIVRADAVLYPIQQAAIAPKISAPIKRFYVERGAHVRAGQLLAELESQDLTGAAKESEAAFELAEATYQTTARATLPQEGQKAELDVRVAKDTLDATQAIFDNRQRLFKEGAIAQKDVNDAQVNLSQARNQYEIAQKRLQDLQGFGREQALKAATAQRDAARGRYEAAQAQLGYARITSPIDGVVTDRPQYTGESVASGSPIVTVMDLSQIVARAHLAPSEASELKLGGDAKRDWAGRRPHSRQGDTNQSRARRDRHDRRSLDPGVQQGRTLEAGVEPPRGDHRPNGAECDGHSRSRGPDGLVGVDVCHGD